MSPGELVISSAAIGLSIFVAGRIGWSLGRRSVIQGGRVRKSVPREVPARTRADRLVDLGDLSNLLDRQDILVVSTSTVGTGVREEVVETAVFDTTGAVRLNCSSPKAVDIPKSGRVQAWPVVYGELVKLLAAATLVVGYSASLHLRMLAQTAERHGLKKLPGTDWGCLMRRYTETIAGPGAQWIELAAACVREGIAVPNATGALEDARSALQLLRILAHRKSAKAEQPRPRH